MFENNQDKAISVATEEENINEVAKVNFDKWKASLQSKDPKVVASLYSDEATFLPTVSGDLKQGQAGAEEYFDHFLQSDPSGEIVAETVQGLGPDRYLHSGLYNFTVGPVDKREIVEARFSFVWAKNDKGEWQIIHHHSSKKPS